MTVCCPTCGQPSETDIVWNEDRHTLVRIADGLRAHLMPQEARVFGALWDARGAARRDFIISRMYPDPDDEPGDALGVMDVRLCSLRKIIKPFGLAIEFTTDRGHSLMATQ